jgi:FtsP/CotA-like multicopper oxidase with cupredoxin domain
MKKIYNWLWIAFGLSIILCVIYKIAFNSFTDHFLGDHPVLTKAVIINEKNYMGNQPVKPEFSYSYKFEVHGHKYTGNAHDNSLQVGDTVVVIYNSDHPAINKPLHPKD